MSDFKSSPEQKNKPANTVQATEDGLSQGESEYVDSRFSTFQHIQLQAAADDQGSRNRITQLQSKSTQVTSSSRIAQLQAKANARPDRIIEPTQNQENANQSTQLKSETISLEEQELKKSVKIMGANMAQSSKEKLTPTSVNKISAKNEVTQLEKKKSKPLGGILGGIKRAFGLKQSKEESPKQVDVQVKKPEKLTREYNSSQIEIPVEEDRISNSILNTENVEKVKNLKAKIESQKKAISKYNTVEFPYIEELNLSVNKIMAWDFDSSVKSILDQINQRKKGIPPGRAKILKNKNKDKEHPYFKDYSVYTLDEDTKKSTERLKELINEHNLIAHQSTELKKIDFKIDEKSTLDDLQATYEEAQSRVNQLESMRQQMFDIRNLGQKERKGIINSVFLYNKPPKVEDLQNELDILILFVELDFENWKKDKEEFKRLDEKSKAWFRSGLTKEELTFLESYKNDILLTLNDDDLTSDEIKNSLKYLSKSSGKPRNNTATKNIENEAQSTAVNEVPTEVSLEEQIKLQEKKVKGIGSYFGIGKGEDKKVLANLKEEYRISKLSDEEKEIEAQEMKVKQSRNFLGFAKKEEKQKLVDLNSKFEAKKEENRLQSLPEEKRNVQIQEKKVKANSNFLGIGKKEDKEELEKLRAIEKDKEQRAQYDNLNEAVFSADENEAKQFIGKTDSILDELDWKSLEDKEKYYDLVDTDKSGIIEKIQPSEQNKKGAGIMTKNFSAITNLHNGEDLIEKHGNKSDSKDASNFESLAEEEKDKYFPILMELSNILTLVADLKKINDGKKQFDAKEKVILTKKLASAAKYGLVISENLLNQTSTSVEHIIPGLSLFIHIAKAGTTFFTRLLAVTSKEQMAEYSQNFEYLNLKNDLVFKNDSRGALGVYRDFRKVKTEFLIDAERFLENNSENIENFNKKYGLELKSSRELDDYVEGVQTHELTVKLHEINLKREVHADWDFFTDLMVIAGDISNLIVGGQFVAGIFYVSGGGLKLLKRGARAVNKKIKGEENALNILGEDGLKHKEYVKLSKHIISIYNKNIPLLSPKNIDESKKLSRNIKVAENIVTATGAYPPEVYKNAGKGRKGYKAVSKLVGSMKKGRN